MTPSPRPTITVRKPRHDFDAIDRHWMGGNAMATHTSNAINLLFPAGERFFVRSVKHFLDQLEDAEMRADVRAFFHQEGLHAAAHERFFEVMRAQGYEIDRFLDLYQKIAFDWLERRFPPEVRLAATAAAEHYTALMAEGALAHDVLAHADPAMRELLLWHAAEELEHKAVAYDVLQRVDPRYSVRILGLAISTAMLGGLWIAGTIMLTRQDRLGWRRVLRELRQVRRTERQTRGGGVGRRVFLRGIREYLRRDFHPGDNDNYHLARDYFARAALEDAA